ncbi:MAG TPA: acetate--CoA ligase family protein [Syntrophales bacterium]|jgi:acetyl-CoA synthetase (ADP-forming)|nr:acetate--CoA ligase family protein [Syntrophales bacterium]HON23161.1 acetate--CoA ligase family protein [Syntrophales bacterium]HOU78156.1 acetate--CoA ligase family protein [Syntrophales bacterium]HPC33077.1 acetate--CoA ligase family protein [Syntrophales bacterium]HQG34492.1 acetate--CoA ligase family protein [Syntrophales bacterium]
MTKAAAVIRDAVARGRKSLSEFDAKMFLNQWGIPVSRDILAADANAAVAAAEKLGYPVVLKAVGNRLTHKTEVGGVVLHVKTAAEIIAESERLLKIPGCESLMVSQMVGGARELVCGLTRDPHFGPAVMFGLGGVLTEVLQDTVFRIAPLTEADARAMMSGIRARRILDPFRGEKAADRESLAKILMVIGQIGMECEEVAEIDVNPLKIAPDGRPVAVDALVVLK